MAFYQETGWHNGEVEVQKAMKVPDRDNPTFPSLSPQLSNHLQIAPIIAIGTLDSSGRPWTTLWGGEKGMARPLGGGIVGIRAPVVGQHDPVVEALVGKDPSGAVIREEQGEGKGRMIGGLTIDPDTRKRVKMFGRMVAGALCAREDEVTDESSHVAEVQLVLKIEQSLGNCPKYINRRRIIPGISKPTLLSSSPLLSEDAISLIHSSDLFFLSTSRQGVDMDTNHRGGPPGFLRVLPNPASSGSSEICWPEYSGNRMYQSLGNLQVNPYAGVCIPNFSTGEMLYLSGETEILFGEAAAELMPRSNLVVKLRVEAARHVGCALPFRAEKGEEEVGYSPYNPVVRYLSSEKTPPGSGADGDKGKRQATLISQTRLTGDISRFRFRLEEGWGEKEKKRERLEKAQMYRSGQYVTLDLSGHLDFGYSHMRDEDPRSLNDDFVRTFTVSNPYPHPRPEGENGNGEDDLKDGEFEITIRKVGVVTDLLFKHDGKTERMAFDVAIKGFGGEFEVVQENEDETVGFIAAGVGITPILPALGTLDLERLRLLWTIRKEDIGLVEDVVRRHPGLTDTKGLTVFVTNVNDDQKDQVKSLQAMRIDVRVRRIQRSDLSNVETLSKIYLCTSVPMRQQLMGWLPGKELLYEDFNF